MLVDKRSRRAALQLVGLASADMILAACIANPATLPATPAPTPRTAPSTPDEITQPATPDAAAFAQYAEEMRQLALANGDQAYGAIVVRNNVVVGLGPSRVILSHDATAHAEMEAIRDASRRLGTRDLSGCRLYSTARPCGMCEMAAYWARIERMYYGPDATDAGAPQYCGR